VVNEVYQPEDREKLDEELLEADHAVFVEEKEDWYDGNVPEQEVWVEVGFPFLERKSCELKTARCLF